VFVKSLNKLNEDISEHVAVADRGRKFHPRLGMLVLARMPCDGMYVLTNEIVSELINKDTCAYRCMYCMYLALYKSE